MKGAGRLPVGTLHGLFTLRDPQLETAFNWGIAAFFTLLVGGCGSELPRGVTSPEGP